jgi:hypothetical protein
MGFFSTVGIYIQSFSEARGAAAPVFRLIDEVDFSTLIFLLTTILSVCSHSIGTRLQYK